MCGLVGYIGKNNAKDILLSSLELLEYRGYDSSGIAIRINDSIVTYKDIGRVSHLRSIINNNIYSNIGIGHTRWATHGGVNRINAHPHSSFDGRFTLVHNGVIENYLELKMMYLSDVDFISSTDSEVVVNLLSYFIKKCSIEEALRKLISVLKGSFALVIFDRDNMDRLYVIKNKTPLLIGKGNDEIMVSSDALAFINSIDSYICLDDMEYAILCKNSVKVFDSRGNIVLHNEIKNDTNKEEISKGDYPYYMLKEIEEIPSCIERVRNKYIYEGHITIDESLLSEIRDSDIIYVASCGTSYYASLYFKYIMEKECKKKVDVLIASEYIYSFEAIGRNPFIIVVSQSGETQDVISFVSKCKEKGLRTLCITNTRYSTLERECDYSLSLEARKEVAVASTKAYVNEVVLFYFLEKAIMNDINRVVVDIDELLISVKDVISRNKEIDNIVTQIVSKEHLYYVGRELGYYGSLEAALKLKEISYIHAEGLSSSELKHGSIALIDSSFPTIALIDNMIDELLVRSNLQEIKSRDGMTFVITYSPFYKDGDSLSLKLVDSSLRIIPLVVVSQYIAYKCALLKGNDIDKPRNLAKSVTVL